MLFALDAMLELWIAGSAGDGHEDLEEWLEDELGA